MPVELSEPDRRTLDPAPVRRVLCQVRFDPAEEVSTRQLGREWAARLESEFPRFDQIQNETITFGSGLDGPVHAQEKGWQLRTQEGNWIVTLMPGSVALDTTAYEDWEGFAARMNMVLDALSEVVDPAVQGRIGLRYINELADMHSIGDQVEASVMGMLASSLLQPGLARVEQRAVVTLHDSMAATLRFHSSNEEPASALDIDVYSEASRRFDRKLAQECVDALNTAALALFQECLRDDFLAVLYEDAP